MSHRFCSAPMMDHTDRHCRYFFRLLSRHARLYTEMVTSGALLHGDIAYHLDFDPAEHPIALQLGGSDAAELAACAQLAARWGYDEINLNVGCPSERVQRGAFGACLMAEPELVADCVQAMRAAAALPVTVKHRIGIDAIESYEFLRRFVETAARAGCGTFIVHARNAILKGLSPKQNREIPPLKYDYVYRLKREFPELTIVVNGGIDSWTQIAHHLQQVDGVMLGRKLCDDPYFLAQADARCFNAPAVMPSRREIVLALMTYAQAQVDVGVPLRHITRHALGLYRGFAGARHWRRMLSNPPAALRNDPRLLLEALATVNDAEAPSPANMSTPTYWTQAQNSVNSSAS